MNTLQRLPDQDALFECVQMSAFTRTIDGREVMFLRGTGSSTAKDFYGTIITPEAQVKMLGKLQALAKRAADANGGLTAFLNHSYKIPEDTLGVFCAASLTTRTSDGVDGIAGGDAGIDYIDLDIECRIIDSNPRAVAAWQQVQAGVRHGWSIGSCFLDGKWASEDPNSPDFDVMLITDIELLEISLVGIPANQRSWCRSMDDLKQRAIVRRDAIAGDARDHLAPAKLFAARDMALRSIIEHDNDAMIHQRSLAVEFRELAESTSGEIDDTDREALRTAAGYLTTIRTGDDGGATSPDDNRDLIMESVGHMARAVGHGLCIRSASHLAKAINCLAGFDGGTVGPGGDENPVEMTVGAFTVRVADTNSASALIRANGRDIALTVTESGIVASTDGILGTFPLPIEPGTLCAMVREPVVGDVYAIRDVDGTPTLVKAEAPSIAESVRKLEPKAGDIVVFHGYDADGATADQMASVAEAAGAGVIVLNLADGEDVTLESSLAAAVKGAIARMAEANERRDTLLAEIGSIEAHHLDVLAALDADAATRAERESEVATLTASIDTAKAELATTNSSIETAKRELDATIKKVEEKKNERMGRLERVNASAFSNIVKASDHADTYVTAEHYTLTPQQRAAALEKQAAGTAPPSAGRDLAI
jgi:hypothetical protein